MRQFLAQVFDALGNRQAMTVSLVVTSQGRPEPLIRTLRTGETVRVVPECGGQVAVTVASING